MHIYCHETLLPIPLPLSLTLDVPVHDLLVVEVLQPLQHLLGVEGDHALVALQRAPLGAEERGEGAAGDL